MGPAPTKFKAWISLEDLHNTNLGCKSILLHLYPNLSSEKSSEKKTIFVSAKVISCDFPHPLSAWGLWFQSLSTSEAMKTKVQICRNLEICQDCLMHSLKEKFHASFSLWVPVFPSVLTWWFFTNLSVLWYF